MNLDAAPEDQPVATTRLVAAPAFWRRFSPRVLSTTLGLAWLAAGRRAAYVTGDVRDNVHMAAGVSVCQAAGCVVTDLAGHPVYSGTDGMLAAADASTHTALLELIASAR